jgi:hypothetical protein
MLDTPQRLEAASAGVPLSGASVASMDDTGLGALDAIACFELHGWPVSAISRSTPLLPRGGPVW